MAKKGTINQLWNVKVSESGRKRIFSTPEALWKRACEYFQWCVDNPLIEYDYKGKDATKVTLEKMRPFTVSGLCLFMGVNNKYLSNIELKWRKSQGDQDREFAETIARIREIIYTQKFEGAAAGFLNPMIIARDLGLVEKKQIEAQVQVSQEEMEQKFKELPEAEQMALLSLAEKLGYEDADFEDLED